MGCRNKIVLAVFAGMLPAGYAGADTKPQKENFTPKTEEGPDEMEAAEP